MKLDGLRHLWRMIKRYPHLVDRKERCVVLGSEYGSFGVVERLLKRDMIVFSFGVGEDVSFDKELKERYHAHIFAFDPTPRVYAWLKKNKIEDEQFVFFPVGLSDKCEKVPFHLPKNEKHISGSMVKHKGVDQDIVNVEMKDFCFIYDMVGINKNIDILKMDIEGSEFAVIPNLLCFAKKRNIIINQICLEWHGRFFANGKKKVKNCIRSLKGEGYKLVYISEDGMTNTFAQI